MVAFHDFPKVVDILAIALIESTFNERAQNKVSKGIMQVNHGPWELFANVQAGVKLLREYYEILGSIPATVQAYNVGIGAYLKGKRVPSYLAKWRKAHEQVSQRYTNRLFLGNNPNITLLRSDRVPGITGSVLVTNFQFAGEDSLCEWKNRECGEVHEAPGEVPTDLGEVVLQTVKEPIWDSSSGSSSDP